MDINSKYTLQLNRHKKKVSTYATGNKDIQYDEDFKKNLVNPYKLAIKQYFTDETEDRKILTTKQVKGLQKRNTQLEEETTYIERVLAFFTPHSSNDLRNYS